MSIQESLLEYTPEELKSILAQMGQPAFRADQLFSCLHKGVDFADMGNLPLSLREQLEKQYLANPVSLLTVRTSKLDGTQKLLYRLQDGNIVEGVIMYYHYGATLCLSTQVGCKMGCAFCASTLAGCVRNLTAAEMLGQVLTASRQLKNEDRIGHVVLMGSGEPFDNYEEVVRFLQLLSHPRGICIGIRNISLSTCGLPERMRIFAKEGLQVTLAVSLHAPNDAIRQKIMPIARKVPMQELLSACRMYIQETGRRMIFEYALIHNVNCSPQHAVELASRLRGMQCHVNLIPLNDVPERGLQAALPEEIAQFKKILEQHHISVTQRREMGDDIEGACGQLRRHYLEKGFQDQMPE